MRVTSLSLSDFRGFGSLGLDLDRPVTVLVGANGSGKTSVLRAVVAFFYWLRSQQLSPPSNDCGLDARDLRVGADQAVVSIGIQASGHRGFASVALSRRNGIVVRGPGFPPFVAALPTLLPFAFLVSTERSVTTAAVEVAPAVEGTGVADWEDHGVVAARPGYARFLAWFKEREDAENARRVAARDFDLQDPQLRAVREAVAALRPGFEGLRIDRDTHPPVMVVAKEGVTLRLDQLSDGERNLVALAGDLARRLVLAHPDHDNARTADGLVLLDEVEQHLHPAWQRDVIPGLQRAFPNVQWIVTTHSPQVVASVPASAVIVLDGAKALPVTGTTAGRDTNAILREVFGVSERPSAEQEEVRAIAALLDAGDLPTARARLELLATRLSEHDDAVLHLRTQLDFAEAGL